jgi:hypothetical protein
MTPYGLFIDFVDFKFNFHFLFQRFCYAHLVELILNLGLSVPFLILNSLSLLPEKGHLLPMVLYHANLSLQLIRVITRIAAIVSFPNLWTWAAVSNFAWFVASFVVAWIPAAAACNN